MDIHPICGKMDTEKLLNAPPHPDHFKRKMPEWGLYLERSLREAGTN